MRIVLNPDPCRSIFHPACFTLEDIPASQEGVDIEIVSTADRSTLGVKRVWAPLTPPGSPPGRVSVNVSPYVRRLWDPRPMCDRPGGLHPAPGRHVSCHISGAGVVSRPAILCGGSCDGQPNTLLSASPADHTIAPGERDEMSVVSEDRLRAEIAFTRGGVTHTDTSIESPAVEGVATLVIDADDIAARFRRLTGGSAEELTAFTVTLRPTQAGFENRRLVRRYTVDRTPRTGRRLAWINRLGTIDYHTFPVAAEFRSGGSHTLVETSSGPRTVATGATQSLRLLSRPCTASEAEWLSEIFSSPAVWTVDGTGFERVGVAPGEVVCTPLSPTVVSVVISPLSQFSTTSTSL